MSTYPTGNPARMGRRVWARVIDAVIGTFLSLALQVAVLTTFAPAMTSYAPIGNFLPIVALLLMAWVGFSMWTMFARGALLGQWLLGLHHVDATTGRRAGGKTFLKYLVQACTFGLAVLITPLSIQAPNRSWFDRMAGVTLVDPREPNPVEGSREQVAAPPAGWGHEESQLTQLGLATPEPVGSAGAGMIQSVPFDSARLAAPTAPPPVERPAPVVVEPPAAAPMVTAPPAETTAVTPPPAHALVTIEGGEQVLLGGTVIVGRSPRPSESLSGARLVVVDNGSVSANHLAFGVATYGPWVMDLRSTNGTSVAQGGADPQRIEPMVRVPLQPGAVVTFGQCRATVSVA